ncbi:MAG: PPC domain-containing protein, partial [Planctomycetia bacterium]
MRRIVHEPAFRRSGCRLVAAVLAALVAAAASTSAFASFPQLSLILPRGAQRGGEREFTFRGQRLGDAEEVLFHTAGGIAVKSIQPVDANSFKAVLAIPAECPLGEQLVQVRCKSGITEFRSLWVGGLPVVDEVEPNSLFEQPQTVQLDTTIHGIVTGEDVDLFVVEAKKGQRISVDIEGLRLGSHRFDPHVSIVDMRRFELASADDSPATLQDGILSVIIPEDGKYVVQVREASYGGDGESRYRLHVGTFPRPAAVYPAGGKAGEKTKVSFIGDASGPIEQEVDVPAITPGLGGNVLQLFARDAAGVCPSSLPFRISAAGNALEQEPNNDVAAATSADIGLVFNGVIAAPGDVDHFRFGAKKGQSFDVECFARRLRTGLDPVVNVLRANGSAVAGNDDSVGPDSAFRFDVPEDGEYLLRVTDHLGRGRPDFVYRVEFAPPKPAFSLSIPRIDRYSQTRQTIFVPRGNRFAVLLNASKRNFDGELVLDGSGLPAGITMHAPRMKQGQNQIPVVFEAAADA